MLVYGDIEGVKLSTGERFRRVVGNGESVLEYEHGARWKHQKTPCCRYAAIPTRSPRRGCQCPECQQSRQQVKELTMHYRNGREAKNGDVIVSINDGKIEAVGVLYGAVPGNDYCNGNIAPIQGPKALACMCDCLHVDDLAAILKEKGLDKRPSGK